MESISRTIMAIACSFIRIEKINENRNENRREDDCDDDEKKKLTMSFS